MMKLELYYEDLGKLNWFDAINECKLIEGGWIVPNRIQLQIVYKEFYKMGLGNLSNKFYWTCEEFNTQYAWSQNFDSGVQHSYTKFHKNNVRPIRIIQ